ERGHIGAHAEVARAQASLQRAHRLPIEAVCRPVGGLPLADGLVQQPLAGVHVVAMRAREVELALAFEIQGLAAVVSPRVRSRYVDAYRQAVRLPRDVRREPEQVARFPCEPRHARLDALLEVDDAAQLRRVARIARRDALHRGDVAVASRALFLPELRAA